MKNRREHVLRHIDRQGLGIEIGPSHNPVAPKREGFRVHVIDHLDQAGLVQKYLPHGVDTNAIEAVDFIWRGEPFRELVGSTHAYDWIIASHVVEHTPDLIRFLNDCDEMLKDDGVLSLVIPDKRYCFDRFRPLTGLARVIDASAHGARIHSAGAVAEFCMQVVARGPEIAWAAGEERSYHLRHGVPEAKAAMDAVRERGEYVDVHNWCFVPHSFRLIVEDLYQLGFTALREIDFAPTEGPEFYVTLGRSGAGPLGDRLELLKRIESESASADDPGGWRGGLLRAARRLANRG